MGWKVSKLGNAVVDLALGVCELYNRISEGFLSGKQHTRGAMSLLSISNLLFAASRS